jgi:2-hydroxychromene-2-carboxylate isomerase
MKTIDFYFDYSSPYAYLASEQIEAIASKHGRRVNWKPILLGAVFKVSNSAPLTALYPPKAKYSVHDFSRSARFAGVAFNQPDPFPVSGVTAARCTLWAMHFAADKVDALVHAIFRAFFVNNAAITSIDVIAELAAGVGIDAAAMVAGYQDEAIKAELKNETETAIAAGVFGAPWMVVDGESFWGNDRLPQVEGWLARGGF